MIINIEVKNRVATYRPDGSDPVCGSNNDTVKFHFDEEWKDVAIKTARFVWGGCYFDQEFEGDSCPVPVFVNLTRVYVGVYAGEPAEEEPAWASTKAEVPYQLSVRCGYEPPHKESGMSYTNQAKGYALEAKAASEIAIAAADRGESVVQEVQEQLENIESLIGQASGMKEVGRLKLRMSLVERMREDGNYDYTFTFGESTLDPANGAVLLRYQGEMVSNPVSHSLSSTVMTLMNSTFTRFVFEHSDPNGVLTYPKVMDVLSGGVVWMQVNIPYDGGECSLYNTEWASGAPRLIVHDNPLAGSMGSEPVAVYLQFPRELKMLPESLYLDIESTTSYLSCTIIGYQ